MENRYCVYVRENGIYYIEDVVTKQQESLRTRDNRNASADAWPFPFTAYRA